MKLNNRITSYTIILVMIALAFLTTTMAQMPGSGGSRGGRGGGDIMGGGGRSGERDMGGRGGGPSRGGMFLQDEAITDAQIDRIIKMYSTRHSSQEVKSLEDQRKNQGREQFIWTLRNTAFWETAEVMREEREYRDILVWCEEYTPDEAKGIRELKDDNYDLYKKRLDNLYNKYRTLIDMRQPISKELMHIRVSDLQLELKERDLTRQYWMASDQKKKESIYSDLKDVENQKYDLIVKQKEIQYTDLQNQIKRLQASVETQIQDVNKCKDPAFKENEVNNRLRSLTQIPSSSFGRRGLFDRGMPPWVAPYLPLGTNTMQGPNSLPEPNK